jgi:Zn-dependent M16 (insulinase) family peptidase
MAAVVQKDVGMKKQLSANAASIAVSDQIHGYRVNRVETLIELNGIYYEFEHTRTGAKHIHVYTDDHENTFGVAFKTVPANSTGVAHILEHTVLCGSRAYPVRDPFFSMLKRSLSTFMNAFTASDWTMYPFSTQNRKDFYNLLGVYLDAAFFPNLDELSFKQEGHRLEFLEASPENTPAQLDYKGVVYNEMQGAMSSPDQVMVRSLLNAMYPDTTYRFNSGGDPAVIPQLTHAQLIEFHKSHYHPSNAFFYSYGDFSINETLKFVEDKVLRHFQKIAPQTEVVQQPRWKEPRTLTYPYPVGRDDEVKKKSQVSLAWLMTDIRDTFEVLLLTVIEQVLLGNAASPLRKALIDSGLGTTLSDGSGFDADNRDTLFACGLKDVDASDALTIEKIIIDVLEQVVKDGIPPELVASAIHQIEFHRKEITNVPYPYGIKVLLAITGNWLHGGDPLRILRLDNEFKRLRQELKNDHFLEKRVQRYFLDNPHRALVTLIPDPYMRQREAERVQAELEQIRLSMEADQEKKIIADTMALSELQETKEDISCLPTLALTDVPPSVPTVVPSPAPKGINATFYDQSTSGIFYFTAAVGAGALSETLIPLVPFYCFALPKIGTRTQSYVQMARRIDAATGGIRLHASSRTIFDPNGSNLPLVSFSAKCLNRNVSRTYDILKDLSATVDFSDLDRLQNLLQEYRAGLESMVVHNGHRLAMSLAARNFSVSSFLSETWQGVHQLQTVKRLTEALDNNAAAQLAEQLASIGKQLFRSPNLKIALVGEDTSLGEAADLTQHLLHLLGAGSGDNQGHGFSSALLTPGKHLPREGWFTATGVSFVAQVFNTRRLGHPLAPALAVISKLLRSMYLHREIREKGGAYGGFALYGMEDGLFSLGSYRDPHIQRTLDVYTGALDFIRSGTYTSEDIKEAVLQVCSNIDKPNPPGIAAREAFFRELIGLSDDARIRFKTDLLALTRKQVVEAAERFFNPEHIDAAVAVISGREQLEESNAQHRDSALRLIKI